MVWPTATRHRCCPCADPVCRCRLQAVQGIADILPGPWEGHLAKQRISSPGCTRGSVQGDRPWVGERRRRSLAGPV